MIINSKNLPSELWTKIIFYAENPLISLVCRLFKDIVNTSHFWLNVKNQCAIELEKKDRKLIQEAQAEKLDYGIIREIVENKIKFTINQCREYGPFKPLLSLYKNNPLNGSNYKNISFFINLYIQAIRFDKKFSLSSSKDTGEAYLNKHQIEIENFIKKSQTEVFHLLYDKCVQFNPNYKIDGKNFSDLAIESNLDHYINKMSTYLFTVQGLNNIGSIQSLEKLKDYLR